MRRTISRYIAATLVALPISSFAQDVTVVQNEVIAPLAGRMYAPAPAAPINFRGTDLGFTFRHDGQLRILFGDTWAPSLADQTGNPLDLGPAWGQMDANNDDPSATICMAQTSSGVCAGGGIASGAVAKLYAAACQLPPSKPQCPKPLETWRTPWNRVGPPVHFFLDASAKLKPTTVTNKQRGPQPMYIGNTPVGGFSSSPAGPGGRAFGIFYRDEYLPCFVDADCGGQGFRCDTSLTTKTVPFVAKPWIPCKVGDAGCALFSLGGLCVDRRSSMAGGSDASSEKQVLAVVRRMEVGVAGDDPTQYKSVSWDTNRFMNPTVRVVESIANPVPVDDARAASGKVLLWGRPAFAGNTQKGRSAKLYFAYADMPTVGADGFPTWTVHYLTGFTNNVPIFKTEAEDPLAPSNAMALALDGPDAKPTEANSVEKYDIIQQMTVAWVAPLRKWVMLYGGNIFPVWANGQVSHLSLFKDLYGIDNPEALIYSPTSSIVMRTADKPWGPWSPPKNLFPKDGNEALAQIGPGGVLRSPLCVDGELQCAPHEKRSHQDGFGNLYGANIIDAWMANLTDVSNGVPTVDLYWNVSTGDPYQVLLMRTQLRR